jgi:N utilization substance protein B
MNIPAPEYPMQPVPPTEQRRNRTASRLAAVQALYQLDMTQKDLNEVLAEFVAHRLEAETPLDAYRNADVDFFRDLVQGAVLRQSEIDPLIAASLAEGWRLSRIDSILRAILRAGVYEIIGRADVPPGALINEYVEVAHDFFGGEEPGVVNGVLDRIAREKRGAGRAQARAARREE